MEDKVKLHSLQRLLIGFALATLLFVAFGLSIFNSERSNTRELRRMTANHYARAAQQALRNGDQEQAIHFQRLSKKWHDSARHPGSTAPEIESEIILPRPQTSQRYGKPVPEGQIDLGWDQKRKMTSQE
jgi:hypothetical protein